MKRVLEKITLAWQTHPRRRWVYVALVLLLIGVGTWWLVSKDEGTKSPDILPSVVINISDEGFTPATLLVKKGQAVTWENGDAAPHRVAANPYPEHTELPDLDSQVSVSPGGTYVYTFNETGTFNYHAHEDPVKYHGTITVVEESQ